MHYNQVSVGVMEAGATKPSENPYFIHLFCLVSLPISPYTWCFFASDHFLEDVLNLGLFGVSLTKDHGSVAEYVGGGCLSMHKILERLTTEGVAQVGVQSPTPL